MRRKPVFHGGEAFLRKASRRAFSLVEVVIALGICLLALIPMMALLSNGLCLDQDSRQQMQAADLATLLIAERRNAPTNVLNSAILPTLNQTYPATAVTAWIDFAGSPSSQSAAAFRLSYQVGTNATDSGVGMIHLLFTWPPGADPGTASGRYELTTQVLMPP
jgi:Tfp pilus assembly protein PilV